MGGGGGYFTKEMKVKEVKKKLRTEEEKSNDMAQDTEVSVALGELLSNYDSRDAGAVAENLDRIKHALEGDIDGTVDTRFGGSVKKHTYVDGISDIDSLVILRDPGLSSRSPQEVLDYFEATLHKKLGGEWEISRGQLAVTVKRENMEIQLLPVVKTSIGIKIASATGDSWSKINPNAFSRRLTKSNEELGMKLVPTIKLVKVINDDLPKSSRLTGYHIESLAIDAFRDYRGPQTTKAMLKHFFEAARGRVLTRIKDKTGQSIYVDEYLGSPGSKARKHVAEVLDRIFRRMRNADAARSKVQWLQLLGE